MSQRLFVDAFADTRLECCLAQQFAGWHTLGRCVQRRQEDKAIWHRMDKGRKRRHPCGRNLGIGGHAIIGQAIPAWEHEDRHPGVKKGKGRLHRSQPFVIARQMGHGPTRSLDFRKDQAGVKPFGSAADGDMSGRSGHAGSPTLHKAGVNRACAGNGSQKPFTTTRL
jgi:hypothetical protein